MEITKTLNGTELVIALDGRLDTSTASDLQDAFKSITEEFDVLIIDFTNLEYISSAGLRVLLYANKRLTLDGKKPIIIRNANEIVKEVFEVTGFEAILTIE